MATLKQRKVVKETLENPGISLSKAMKKAGYSTPMSRNPQELTQSKGWQELMKEYLPDDLLAQKHLELLNSTGLDHMIFPLGPEDDMERVQMIEDARQKAIKKGEAFVEPDLMCDADIKEMLKGVNCIVRRIVHGETARHVYFWGADNKARKDALDMAYKLKGQYAPDKTVNVNVDVDATITPEDLELIKLIREHDRNSTAKAIPSTGHIHDGMDSQPQD